MYRRLRHLPAACLIAAMPAMAARGTAQTAADAFRHFAVMADSLARLREVNRVRMPKVDTLPFGPLRLVVPPDLAARVRPALPLALQAMQERFRDVAFAPSGLLQVDRAGPEDQLPRGLAATFSPAERHWNAGFHFTSGASPADSVSAMLLAAVSDGYSPAAGVTVMQWLGSRPLSWEPNPGDLREAYIELVTHPMHAPQGCLRGDLQACRRAFGLVPTGTTARDWYDAGDRRTRIVQLANSWELSARRGEVEACVDRRDGGACDRLFDGLSPAYFAPPLSASARGTLASLALQVGGEGAFARLEAEPENALGQRLAATAGVPLDSLLTLWRTVVIQTRPTPVGVSPASSLVAIGWVLLLGIMALRSTRWR